MAESRSVTVVPLRGDNYPTWKIQSRMALMKEGLWRIVTGEETAPETEAERAKFATRKDRALATIVLSVDPSLLYLVGDPEDPVVVWKKLGDQFQKRTWATRLDLRRKLHAARLRDGDSAQEHIKLMTEIFDTLTVAGETVSEEDRVVYLLASLPESYNVLVTALEASENVPKLEVVTERILHQERKFKDRSDATPENAMISRRAGTPRRKSTKCHHCGKPGHFKKDCWILKAEKEGRKDPGAGKKTKSSEKATTMTVQEDSDSDSVGLIAGHALSVSSSSETSSTWIIDSGATCHMCLDSEIFTTLYQLEDPIDVVLGDGRTLVAVGRGKVVLDMVLPSGESKPCTLHNVLYVPSLSYNLLSVAKASQRGKTVEFTKSACYVVDKHHKMVAKATKVGSLYQLDHKLNHKRASFAEKADSKEDTWHKRYGHLGIGNLRRLVREEMADGFDFDAAGELTFCESCPQGKHSRAKFPSSDRRGKEPLDLVHSDLCGKMNEKSLGGAQYFLSFIDDSTRYVWVYFLKSKDQVFEKFLEWKAMVEKSVGRKLKVFRTDNGGEYTSKEFERYLMTEGVRHELTIPKTPEQNGVSERMNRTLVEATRAMLVAANLPHRFWAEALSTATYLRNRSPTKAVPGMTPFEAWTGEKPRVDGLRVFGCQAFAHIPKDERKKLDSKSRKCVLLGYGMTTKGYRLYDPVKKRVFQARDVIFNEQKCGFEESSPVEKEPEPPVLFEFSDEPTEAVETPVRSDEPTEAVETPVHTVRRSDRQTRPPDFYGYHCNLSQVKEPKSVGDALTSQEWVDTMQAEIESLHDNDVWDLVPLPEGRKAVGSKWVYKVKRNADGYVERCKARLVAQGYSQKEGLDYDETFSPVVRSESVHSVIALASKNGLKLHQMDITTAFLNGNLQEEVYMQQPEGFVTDCQEHLTAVKRILRYLKGTATYGLMFAASVDTGGGLIRYSDADWAGDVNDRKSTSGYLFMMNGAAVSWRSQKQTCVALSTAEAEYIALAAAAQEATWMRKLMKDFHESQAEPVTIYEDNQSAICIAKNPQSHHKTKHVDIKYHYVRDKVQDVTIKVQYCPTNDMIADILTKGLTHDRFTRLRALSGVKQSDFD